MYKLKIQLIADSIKATDEAYAKDKRLSRAIIDQRIHDLEDWKSKATRTPIEIKNAEAEINKLRSELEHDLTKDKMEQADKLLDYQKQKSTEGRQHEIEQAKFSADERQKLWQQSVEAIGVIQQSASSIVNSYYEREVSDLEKAKEREISLVGENTDAKAKIEENYNRQIAETRRRQAFAERQSAIAQIAINTAVAITDVLRTGGGAHYLDFGTSAGILSAIITATGLAQVATVLAQPLPAYKTGKRANDSYEGLAIVGDGPGPELMVNRSGGAQLYTRPTLFETERGDTVYTASQTAAILADMNRVNALGEAYADIEQNRSTVQRLREGRMREQAFVYQMALQSNPGLTEAAIERAFGKALDNRPENVTILDEIGVRRGQRRGRNFEEYLEKRHRW